MQTLNTAGLIVISQGKLLLAYSGKKQAWYLPGGKVEPNETPVHALLREVKEELLVELHESRLRYYMHVSAPAYGEQGLQMEQDCFIYHTNMPWQASSEIEAIDFFSYAQYQQQAAQVPGVMMVFEQLLRDKLVTE